MKRTRSRAQTVVLVATWLAAASCSPHGAPPALKEEADAATPDAATPDAATPDAGTADAATPDDAGSVADAGPPMFIDTFAGSADTDPLYGLNDSLDSRQVGSVRASYTRVSGVWNSAKPPAAWYVQVNPSAFPNKLLFSLGTSAIMLDAPVRADASGHYTVATTMNPVVGDTSSGDWASLVLSRSRASWGYVTNADVDLGLTVRSSGALTLFRAGTAFWSGRTMPAEEYAVSLTVSTGPDKKLSLVVNGDRFSITGPPSPALTAWPSTPYLYLGAYLTDPASVTTFGSGRSGEGLSVSRVDAEIPASARLFVDTFDGSADTDPTGYGLNDGLAARQPSVVTTRYTRTSGTLVGSTAPAPWASQVNHPLFPNTLSFWNEPSAVRLNQPVSAGLGKTFQIRVNVAPSVAGTDSSASVALSGSPASQGHPAAPDSELGLTLTPSGHLQLFQKGVQTWSVEPIVSPKADGSFDVTLTVGHQLRQVELVVNDASWSVTLASTMPQKVFLSLGAHLSGSNVVTTFDDLRISQLGGLTYYGYFDIMDPTDHVNHGWEVAHYTNLNLYLDGLAKRPYLDDCRPQSCAILIQWEQFQKNAANTGLELRPDSAAAVADVRANIGSNLDKVGAIYLIDEPYMGHPDRNVTAADMQAATDQVRAAFPGKILLLTLDSASLNGGDTRAIPKEIDMVGFDQYCAPKPALQTSINLLQARLSPEQSLYLIPESAANRTWCSYTADATVAQAQGVYRDLAAENPRVAYLMNFGWWLGEFMENGHYAGEHTPFTTLPLTSAAQLAIGESIIGTQ